MNKTKKLTPYPESEQREKTNFISRSTKMIRFKKKLRLFLWYVIAMGVCFTALTTTLLASTSPLEAVKPIIVEVSPREPEMTIEEHICNATGGENCDVLYNLMKAENGKLDQNVAPVNTNGTTDHSWYQINSVHIIGSPYSKGRGTITMPCVYDLYCVSKWVNNKIKAGEGNIWVAWDRI